jgi:hypothetical protein
MNKEVFFNFPIKRLFFLKDSEEIEESIKKDNNNMEAENKKLNDEEWEQEYYLIYNSYILENL